MKIKYFYILILLVSFSCKKDVGVKKVPSKYPKQIGNSSFNVKKDNANFVPCGSENKIAQYFNLGNGLPYKGEKKALETVFKEKYNAINVNESGLIRIRFVVNCKGETGRFRVLEMNEEYKKFKFNNAIVHQLLKITQELSGWKIQQKNTYGIDYYQYLIFKIKNGKLIEILP